MRGSGHRRGGALRSAGTVALTLGALALVPSAARAADEPVGRPVPPSVVDALIPGGTLDDALHRSGAALAGRPVTYGTPLLYVSLDLQRLTDEPASVDGPLRVSELSDPSLTDPADTAGPFRWLVPVLAAGGPFGYALVQESGAVGSLVVRGADLATLVHAITALPPVSHLVATQVGGLWAVHANGDAIPVDKNADAFMAADFPDRAPGAGLLPEELRIAVRDAAVAAQPSRHPALDRRLLERLLGVALACAGAATLVIFLPRRRPRDEPGKPDAQAGPDETGGPAAAGGRDDPGGRHGPDLA